MRYGFLSGKLERPTIGALVFEDVAFVVGEYVDRAVALGATINRLPAVVKHA